MKKYIWWIVIAVIVIFCIYICRMQMQDSTELEFFIAFIGTAFTILGIAITFDQIRQTKSKAEETRKAVEETKGRMQTMALAFNITDSIRLAEATEVYLRNKQQGESLIKLQEFSRILISINDEELKDNNEETSKKLTQQMQMIKLDISSLNKPMEECCDIDWKKIIRHVEDSKDLLSEHFTKVNKKV